MRNVRPTQLRKAIFLEEDEFKDILNQVFGKSEDGIKIFNAYVGRPYEFGRNDFFEAWDILCHINNYYKLEYLTGAQSQNSFSWYLIDLYGERTVYNLMLYPETIEEVTDKTWEQLASEWEEYIRNKYNSVENILVD